MNIEYAIEEAKRRLPPRWLIRISAERGRVRLTLIDPFGDDGAYPAVFDNLGVAVEEAIRIAETLARPARNPREKQAPPS